MLITSVSFNHKLSNKLTVINRCYLALVFGLLLLVEVINPDFINQFELRPNIWFVEYLKYPQEVTSMLVNGFVLSSILATVISFGDAFFYLKQWL